MPQSLCTRGNVSGHQHRLKSLERSRQNTTEIVSGLVAEIPQFLKILNLVQILEIVDVVTIRAAHPGSRSGASLPVKPTAMTDQRGFRTQFDDLSTTKRNKILMLFTEFRHIAIHSLKR